MTVVYDNTANGLYVPKHPDELFDISDTIFVGNITAVNITRIVESIQTPTGVEHYTSTMAEYTVQVEEFLKNPLNLEAAKIKPETRSASFADGDRVLFYAKGSDGNLEYLPESFLVPQYCDAKSALEETRIQGVNYFRIMQDDVEKRTDFAASVPIQFIYEKDMGTLSGTSFDAFVGISRQTSHNNWVAVFEKEIHAESRQCEWIATAKWEITLEEGNYRLSVNIRENGSSTGYHGPFSVVSNITIHDIIPPLRQFKSGTSAEAISCGEGLELVLKSSDGTPACLTPETKMTLIERGWAKPV